MIKLKVINFIKGFHLLDIILIFCSLLLSFFIVSKFSNDKYFEVAYEESDVFVRNINEDDLILGNPDASLFIVEYGDLQCPFCQKQHPELKKFIKSDYGLSGDVAWVWRHGFHIDEISLEKAETVECVRLFAGENNQKIVWDFINLSLEVVEDLEYPFERYEKIFKHLNIDKFFIENCKKNNFATPVLNKSYADVSLLDIHQTPYIQIIDSFGNLFYENSRILSKIELDKLLGEILYSTKSITPNR